jgi:hypothetical protein
VSLTAVDVVAANRKGQRPALLAPLSQIRKQR